MISSTLNPSLILLLFLVLILLYGHGSFCTIAACDTSLSLVMGFKVGFEILRNRIISKQLYLLMFVYVWLLQMTIALPVSEWELRELLDCR